MKKILTVVAIALTLTGCFSFDYAHGAGRKPPAPPVQVQQAPPPDPEFQCPFCKRMFKLSEGRIIRFRVHDTEKVICVDCFYDSLEYTQKRFLHPEKK